MCSITGKMYFNQTQKVELPELKRLTDSVVHGGSDDEGYYIDENIGLGFQRLSIVDLKSGNQPFSVNKERYWITFNGEIYNFQEQGEDLTKKIYLLAADNRGRKEMGVATKKIITHKFSIEKRANKFYEDE